MVNERLTVFLYVLMRDHLPVGEVHRIIAGHLQSDLALAHPRFSDPDLEAIASKVAASLVAEPKERA